MLFYRLFLSTKFLVRELQIVGFFQVLIHFIDLFNIYSRDSAILAFYIASYATAGLAILYLTFWVTLL